MSITIKQMFDYNIDSVFSGKKKLNNFLIPLFILQLKLGTSVTIHDNIQLEMSEEILFFLQFLCLF